MYYKLNLLFSICSFLFAYYKNKKILISSQEKLFFISFFLKSRDFLFRKFRYEFHQSQYLSLPFQYVT